MTDAEIRQKQREQVRETFRGLDSDALKSLPTDALKARSANTAFLSHLTNKNPKEISGIYEQAKKEIGEKVLGTTETLDDLGFYSATAKWFDREDAIKAHSRKLAEAGYASAITSQFIDTDDGIKSVSWAQEYRKFADHSGVTPTIQDEKADVLYEHSFREAYRDSAVTNAETKKLGRDLLGQLEIKEGLETEGPERNVRPELVERLQLLPKDERMKVYAFMQANADQGKIDTSWVANTNKALDQGAARVWGDLNDFSARNIIRKIRSGDPLYLPNSVSGINAESITQIVGGAIPMPSVLKGLAVQELTPDQRASALELADDLERYVDVSEELRDIRRGSINPIQHAGEGNTGADWFNEKVWYPFVGQSPYLALASSGFTMPLLYGATADMRYDEMRQRGVDDEQASVLSKISAIPEIAIERLQWKGLTGKKLGGAIGRAQDAIAKRIGPAGAHVLGQLAAQNTQEAIQDITNLVVQDIAHELDKEFPDVNWSEELPKYKSERMDTFWALLPMAFLGAGVGTARDIQDARSFLANTKRLEALGVDSETAIEIVGLERDGKVEEASKKFADTERGDIDVDYFDGLSELQEKLLHSPHSPQIKMLRDGKAEVKFEDGNHVTVSNIDAARIVVDDFRADRRETLRKGVESILETYGDSVEFRNVDGRTLETLFQNGMITEAEARSRIQDLSAELGQDFSALPLSAFNVDAANVSTWKDGVFQNIVEFSGKERPQAIVEDISEGYFWNTIQLGDRNKLIHWLDQYQQYSKDILVENVRDVSDKSLVEAWSSLATAYFTGKVKESSLPAPIRKAFELIGTMFAYLMQRFGNIDTAIRSGKVDAGFQRALAESVGLDVESELRDSINQDRISAITEMLDDLERQPTREEAFDAFMQDVGMPRRTSYSISSINEMLDAVEASLEAKQIDTSDLDALDRAAAAGTLRASHVFKYISDKQKHLNHPLTSLWEAIADNPNAQRVLGDVKFYVDPNLQFDGLFYHESKKIFTNGKWRSNAPDAYATGAETVLHESFHALTSHLVNNDGAFRDVIGKAQRAVFESLPPNIKSIVQKEFLNKAGASARHATLQGKMRFADFFGEEIVPGGTQAENWLVSYALTDPHEMAALAFTNKEVISYLSKLPSTMDGKSVWQTLVDAFKKFFSFGQRSLHTDILETFFSELESDSFVPAKAIHKDRERDKVISAFDAAYDPDTWGVLDDVVKSLSISEGGTGNPFIDLLKDKPEETPDVESPGANTSSTTHGPLAGKSPFDITPDLIAEYFKFDDDIERPKVRHFKSHAETEVIIESSKFYAKRTFKLDLYDNVWSVKNDLLRVHDTGQGRGKHILNAWLQVYQDLDIKRMEIDAAWVGSYLWAKLGFVPNRREWNTVRNVYAFGFPEAEIYDPAEGMAALAARPNAKKEMYGWSWSGAFDLTNAAKVQAYQAYLDNRPNTYSISQWLGVEDSPNALKLASRMDRVPLSMSISNIPDDDLNKIIKFVADDVREMNGEPRQDTPPGEEASNILVFDDNRKASIVQRDSKFSNPEIEGMSFDQLRDFLGGLKGNKRKQVYTPFENLRPPEDKTNPNSPFAASAAALKEQNTIPFNPGEFKIDFTNAEMPVEIDEKTGEPIVPEDPANIVPMNEQVSEVLIDSETIIELDDETSDALYNAIKGVADTVPDVVPLSLPLMSQLGFLKAIWQKRKNNDPKSFAISADSLADPISNLFREPAFRHAQFAKAIVRLRKLEAKFLLARDDENSNKVRTSRKDIAYAIAQFEALVSVLPVEVRGKVSGASALAKKATDAGRLNYMLDRIRRVDVALDDYLASFYRDRFERSLKRAMPKKDKSGKLKSSLGAETAAKIPKIERFSEMSAEESEIMQTALLAKMGEPDVTDETYEDFSLLRQFGAIKDRDGLATLKALEDFNDLLRSGRDAFAEAQLRRRENNKTLRLRAAAQADMDRNPDREDVDAIRKAERKGWAKVKSNIGKFELELLDWRQALISVFGDNDTAEYFERRAQEARNANIDSLLDRRERLKAFLNDELLIERDRDKNKFMFDLKETPESTGIFRQDGRELLISQDEAIYYTMVWDQNNYRRNLTQHDGIDSNTIAQMEEYLSSDAKKYRAWLRSEYAKEYDRINAVYREQYGVDLPKEQNYSPVQVDIGQEDLSLDPTLDTMNTGLAAGFTKMRVRHSHPIRRQNASVIYWAHATQSDYYVTHSDLARTIKGFLSDRDFRNAIVKKKGTKALSTLDKWAKQFHERGVRRAGAILAGEAYMSRLNRALATVGLAYNIGTMFKQFSAAFASWIDIPTTAFWRGFAAMLFDPSKFAYVWKSATIRRRILNGFSPEMQAAMSASEFRPARMVSFLEKGLASIGFVDAIFTTVSATIAYDYHYREAKKIMSEEQAKAEAMRRMDLTVARTSQPADNVNRSLLEINADASAWAKAILMFRSEPRQKLALTIMGIRQGNPKAAIVAWMWLPLMTYVANEVFKSIFREDDEEEALDPNRILHSIVAGQSMGAPILGDAAEAASALMFDQKVWNNNDNQVFQAILQLQRALKKDVADMDIKDVNRYLRSISIAVGGAFAGVGVGSRTASDIYQLAGNVSEWVADPPMHPKDVLSDLVDQQETLDDVAQEKRDAEQTEEPDYPPVFDQLKKLKVGSGLRAQGIKKLLDRTPEDQKEALKKQLKEAKLLSSTVEKQLRKL